MMRFAWLFAVGVFTSRAPFYACISFAISTVRIIFTFYIFPSLKKEGVSALVKLQKKSILYGASSKIKDIPLGQGGIGDCDGLVVRGEVSLQHDSSCLSAQ